MPFADFKTSGKGHISQPPDQPRKKVQEETMKFAMIAAVCAAIALAPAASASGLSDCVQMSKKAAEALNTAQPGTTTEAARVQVQAGQSFCASSMYAQGVARYSRALQLLGKG
jgi:hypothetical protein